VGDGVAEIFAMGGQAFDLKVRYVAGSSVSLDDKDSKVRRVGKSFLVNAFRDECENKELTVYAPTCADLLEEAGFATVKKLNSGTETFESSFFDDVLNASMLARYGWRELRVRAPELDAKSQSGIVSRRSAPTGPGNLF